MYQFIFSHLNAKNVAWDCGTGPGQVASVLAEHFDEIYASDISQEQMDHAPKKSNITYYKVPAEDTEFSSNIFDLITVAQAIHWFDFEQFYTEVNRTGRPGALLAVIGYGMVQVLPKIDKKLHQFYNDMFNRYFNKNRKFLDEKYQTIPFPFEEISTPQFERTIEWEREHLEGFLNSWSPVQKFKDDHGQNPVDTVIQEIDPLWGEDEKLSVTFPIFLRLGKLS
ncbi:MAG: class I SAM-dependent methyltransferase [Balneolaceae bacterium]|nr:class I SAM-dependent methyltransferase [Balneolaceae bacterium]